MVREVQAIEIVRVSKIALGLISFLIGWEKYVQRLHVAVNLRKVKVWIIRA